MSDSSFGREQYVIYCSQLRATPSADCNISHIALGLSNYLILNALQVFIKTAAVSGIAFFWVNFTVESLKMAWHIISYSQDAASDIEDAAKVVCENCQELYDNDERHLINGSKLCEACRSN